MIDLRFLSRAVSSLAVLSLGLCLSAPAAKPAAAAVANKKPAARAALRKRAAGSGHAALLKTRATPRLRTGVSRSRTSAALIHSKVARPGAIRGKAIRPTGVVATRRARRALWSPWTEPTYADSVVGDNIEGDDLVVRQAAAEALGPYNGTIVVADLETGRVLSIVNQKLGLKGAFQPCSTVKVVVSFASLNEGLIEPDTKVRLSRRTSLDLTGALAHSNNLYFAKMGESLGFDRFEKYAKLFGLGEKAGLDIAGEEAGTLATETPRSGMGMMTSFGDGIRLTPLQLSSIVGTVANGGTMYYLQYPKTLNPGVHLGWFGSFNDLGKNKVSVVVLLTGGRGVGGSVAAGIAGNVYRNLTRLHYFGADQTIANQGTQSTTPTKLVSMENTARP